MSRRSANDIRSSCYLLLSRTKVGVLPMITRQLIVVFTMFLFAGCATYEGKYVPSCPAYAGDTIELQGGTFVWDKFSDAVAVDDDGERVDQFPDYPMQGNYRIDDEAVMFESSQGDAITTLYLQKNDGQHYLLTLMQYEQLKTAGKSAECALVRGD